MTPSWILIFLNENAQSYIAKMIPPTFIELMAQSAEATKYEDH